MYKFAIRNVFSADQRSFLPAAMEVLETPPNPIGSALALAISAGALASLIWATVGKVDIVAVANGKFVSHQRTQVVQPFETASIAAILVEPGQYVRAGDPLIELDKTAASAEREKASGDRVAAHLDRLRLQAFLAGSDTLKFSDTEQATPQAREHAQAQLPAQLAARAGKLASLQQEQAQRRAEKQSLVQTVGKIEQALPLVAERAEIREKAAAAGNASVLSKLESKQLLVETKSELEITKFKIASLDASIAALEQRISETDAEIRATAMGEMNRARDREASAREAMAKADRRVSLQTLRAPIEGTVQQMHVATVGSVVTPAQQLLSIAPQDDKLEIMAVIENRDIGFVRSGQEVEIKVDAFPFTRYGLLRGVVTSVDKDAETTSAAQSFGQGTERAADRMDSVEASERLRYMAHVAVGSQTLDIDGRPAELLSGMSVRAEIITGKRRIIDFLLAPLREHAHDSLRER